MGMFGEWSDPMNLNKTDRSIKVKVYLPESYDGFGSGFDDHKKYLPCMAILERLSGDSFYNFTMLTEDGPIRSCGYGAFYAATDITKKLTRRVWHYQVMESIKFVEEKSQPVVVVRCHDNLLPVGEISVFESVDKAIDSIRDYDRWALVADLVFEK